MNYSNCVANITLTDSGYVNTTELVYFDREELWDLRTTFAYSSAWGFFLKKNISAVNKDIFIFTETVPKGVFFSRGLLQRAIEHVDWLIGSNDVFYGAFGRYLLSPSNASFRNKDSRFCKDEYEQLNSENDFILIILLRKSWRSGEYLKVGLISQNSLPSKYICSIEYTWIVCEFVNKCNYYGRTKWKIRILLFYNTFNRNE